MNLQPNVICVPTTLPRSAPLVYIRIETRLGYTNAGITARTIKSHHFIFQCFTLLFL